MLKWPVMIGVAAVLAATVACSDPLPPFCDGTCALTAIVYGTVRATSNYGVPNATVTVRLLADTSRNGFVVSCAGDTVARASQDMDTTGVYRLQLHAGGSRRKVCVEVTGDPHGLYSDVGLKKQYGGFVELRPTANRSDVDSVRVIVKYSELALRAFR